VSALPREWIVIGGAALGTMNVLAVLAWMACRWRVVLGRSRAVAEPTPFVRPERAVAAAEELLAAAADERDVDRTPGASGAEARLAADLERWRRRAVLGATR